MRAVLLFAFLALSCKKDTDLPAFNSFTVAGVGYTPTTVTLESSNRLLASSGHTSLEFAFYRPPAPGTCRIFTHPNTDTSNYVSVIYRKYDTSVINRKLYSTGKRAGTLTVAYDGGKMIVQCPPMGLDNGYIDKDSILVSAYVQQD